MPWQSAVVDVAFELDDHGRLVYSEVDVSVPRQSGKTAMTFARMVWRATVAARLWGPQRVAYTAQTHKMARRKLERDFYDMLKGSKSFPEVVNQKRLPTRANEFRLSLNNGSEHVRFGTNSYLGIDAPSRAAGHGDVLDEGTIDEAFAHQDDDVEQAMLPAQATRFNPQIWVQSTAGDDKSFYWYRKILAGRAQADGDGVAYFEWGIPDEADIDDVEVWWAHHPALGHTITESFLRSQLDKARRSPDGEGLWRRAFGNQWVKIPILEEYTPSVLPPEDWAACCSPSHAPSGDMVFGVDVTPEREKGHAAIVACDNYGTIEVVDSRPGVGWLSSKVIELGLRHRGSSIVVDSASPAHSFADEWERAGVEVQRLTSREMAGACGTFYDAVLNHTIQVRTDAVLDRAANAVRKRESGDVWYWARKDATADVSPIVAASIARWAAIGPSVYASRGFTVLG